MSDADPGMETPLKPLDLEADAAPSRGRRRRDKSGEATPPSEYGLRASLLAGATYTIGAWRVLLAVLVVHLLLAMTVVMPLQARMAERLDGHAHAPSLSGTPDAYDARFEESWGEGGLAVSVWNDAKRLERSLFDSQRITLYWIVLVAWLFGAVVAGGHIGLAVSGERATVTAFLGHGAKHFWTMLRVGLVFGLVYYLLGRFVLEAWAKTAEVDEKWGSDTRFTGFYGEAIRTGVMVIGFLWMRVACDLARADLVVFGRKSAVGAVLRGLWRTVTHPIRTFGLALAVGLPAIGVIVGCAAVLNALGFGVWLGVATGFVLIQLATLARLASRAALLAGDVHLLHGDIHARP